MTIISRQLYVALPVEEAAAVAADTTRSEACEVGGDKNEEHQGISAVSHEPQAVLLLMEEQATLQRRLKDTKTEGREAGNYSEEAVNPVTCAS